MSPDVTAADFLHLAPVLFVAIWGCLVLLICTLGGSKSLRLGPVSLLGVVLGLAVCAWAWHAQAAPTAGLFAGMMLTDGFALALDAIILFATGITVLVTGPYVEEHRCTHEEVFPLLLLVASGMMLMVHAADFVALIIGLETMSLGIYALVACWWGNRKSAEAGLKYLVMGAVASAVLLYGVALLYGATGETNFTALGAAAAEAGNNLLFISGMLLVLCATAFKVALVPFHLWAPDAYEGAPTPITGLMATGVKAAGFGVLVRILTTAFDSEALGFGQAGWVNLIWTLSVLTMTVGNLAALRQTNIKRMLAYSSIAHAGTISIALVTLGLGQKDVGPLLYYLTAYAATTLGAFAAVSWLGRRNAEQVDLKQWEGLAGRHPLAALAMTICLASLGGIPPTAGFFAKFYLFKAALAEPELLSLVIIAVLNSVVSIYYYLRPVVAMYFRPQLHAHQPLAAPAINVALTIAVLLVLVLGLAPGIVLG